MDATEPADTEATTGDSMTSAAEADTTTSKPDMEADAQPATMAADNTTEEAPATADEATGDGATADQPAADEARADQPQADQADQADQATADEPQADQATADEPQADQPQATDQAADTSSDGPDSASDNPQDAAEDGRPLGAADEMADMVNSAIDQMNETAAEEQADGAAAAGTDAPADETAETEAPDQTADAAEAPTADETADAPAAADEEDDAPAAADESADAPASDESAATEATAAPPAAPAPRVYEGPEPTTMEELLAEQSTEIRSLKHGDVVEGSVVRVDKDEILVDIGAKSEGVISNRELYGRNAESQPALNIGDVVLVYVLQPESPEGHAVLSLRRAGLERKWRSMQEQLDAGAIIEAPVIDHNKGGLIVDCGIRGFVPISQIVDFPRRPQNEQPRDAAQEIAEKLQPYVGRKLRLKILEVNRKANRLILSEKVALYEERREKRDELFSSLQVGQKVTGTVRSIAPFGVFVDLGGIDGLVHKSELSWNKVNNPEAGYRVGEEVEAEVIDINHERGRISLSIRRLQPDPWHSTVADLNVGDLIDGTVTKIVNFGAFVRVRDGLEGLIHISELSHQRVNHPGDVVHEGQTIKLKIISLDQERHRLGLSLKQAEEAPARPEPAATSAPSSAPRERRPRQERSFDMSQAVQEPEGGIDNTLAAAFAQVRQQMEETEAARGTSDVTDEEMADAPAATAEDSDEAPAGGEAEAPADATADETAEAEAEAPAEAEATADESAAAEATADEPAAAEASAEPETADEPVEAEAPAEAEAEATADEPAAAEATPEPAAEAPAEAEAAADEPAAAEATPEPAAEAPAEAEATADEPAAAEATTAEPAATSAAAEADPTADAPSEDAIADAMVEMPSAETTSGDADATADDEKPARKGRASGKPDADSTADTEGDSSSAPAEGADDAAPSDGADREEPSA
jgi:small subunit ribosomal protein S1